MDEFDRAQTCSEGDDGSEVLGGLFASERDPLEALEPADTLLDARAGLVEGSREEGRLVLFVGLVWDDRGDAARLCRLAIGLAGVAFVADDSAGLDVGSDVEQGFEVTRVGRFSAGQIEGDDVAGGVRFCMDFRGEAAARTSERLAFLPPFAPAADTCGERANLLIEQATALGEPLEDPLLLYSVLYGVWVANYIAFNGDAMHELSAQFLVLAEKQVSVVPLVVAHRIMAVSLLCTGDILQARVHSDRAAALHSPTEHRPVAARFGQDNGVAILAYRSLGSWLLGYPAASLAEVESAVRAAREIGQAATLMFVLTHAALTHLVSRNYVEAKGEAEELAAVAGDKGAFFWKAIGTVARGWVFALTGKASEAVDPLTSGLGAFRSTGSTLWMPLHMSCLAVAHRDLNRFDEARRCFSEAMTAIETTGERWYEAEVLRVGGEIAMTSPEWDMAKAEMFFDRALRVARQQQAKSWELRAAMSMARLKRDQGKRDEARELLAPIYGWFTEGFDTLDLQEAKTLLDGLAS